MKHLKFALVAASFAFAGAALAQNAPGGGPGGPGANPAFAAMRTACQADAAKLCAGKEGREQGQCLRDNASKVSKPCADALAALPPPGQGGGGQRPPGGN